MVVEVIDVVARAFTPFNGGPGEATLCVTGCRWQSCSNKQRQTRNCHEPCQYPACRGYKIAKGQEWNRCRGHHIAAKVGDHLHFFKGRIDKR